MRPLIRVATFNLYNPPYARRARFETQRRTLGRIDADIIALQEVAAGIHLYGEPSSFLADAFGLAGVRAWHQENLGLFRTGLALLARYPIVQSSYHEFADSIWFDPKGWLVARIETPVGPLTVVDVHMASTEDPRIKASQFSDLARGVLELEAEGPILVLGDFNTEREHPIFAEFMARTGAESLFDHLRAEAVSPTWNESLASDCAAQGGQTIDHILALPGENGRGRIRFRGGRIVVPRLVPHPSDHCPVVAEIEVVR